MASKLPYRHTKDGHRIRLWHRVSKTEMRKIPATTMTRDEFDNWIVGKTYDKLYKAWKKSNFDKRLTPSVDRLNTKKGYELKNIELVTWELNQSRAYDDRKNSIGTMGKDNRPVIGYKDGKKYAAKSASEASRKYNVNRGNIVSNLQGKLRSAGGYTWNYAKEDIAFLMW